MPTAEDGLVYFEGSQTSHAMHALTDSGDNQNFTTNASSFSERSGFAPTIWADGLSSGGVVTPAASGTNDLVDYTAIKGYLAGLPVTETADTDVTITRAGSDVSKITSLTIDSSGSFAAIAGTDGASSAFSETRDAAGGPPYIPVGSFEFAQIRLASNTAAAILASEIYDTIGVHKERYDDPYVDYDSAEGTVSTITALPLSHTGGVTKKIYASYAEPVFTLIPKTLDYVPAETSYSVGSTQYYSGAEGAVSKSLNQGSFTALLNTGINDQIIKLQGNKLWFKFFPDQYKTGYILDHGTLGVTSSFPVADSIQASCTISAEKECIRVDG